MRMPAVNHDRFPCTSLAQAREQEWQPMHRSILGVVSIFMGTNGYLDDIPVSEIKRFEKEVLEYIEVKYNHILEAIKKEKQLSDSTVENLKKAAEEFKALFKSNA